MDNVYVIDNRFIQDSVVPCYATDASFHLKPVSFMDMAQEMAYQAASRLHFGYDDLQTHHTVWVLSRFRFIFNNPPVWRDEVSISTWHKGLEGLFFMRDFELRAKGDTDFADKSKALVSGTSSWLIMNEQTRRLVRSDVIAKELPFETSCLDDAIKEPCPKITLPKGSEPVLARKHTVSYSDVDIIGHTNNARYIVMAMDCIDREITFGRLIKEVAINFNKETRPGEEIELYSVSEEAENELIFTIEGRVEGRSCFCARIIF